jgi:hypothetical protein
MSSDELLRSLARVAREEAKNDEGDARWSALAHGELDPEDVAALKELADADAEAERKLEAYRPLDDAAKDRIAARIPSTAASPALAAAKVVPMPQRPRRAAWIAAAVAIAAGVAVWRGAPAPEPTSTLPAYAMTMSSGDRATRGGGSVATEETEVAPDSRLVIWLRPAKQVSGPVGVRAFLVQGGVARPWSPPVKVSADGAVAIEGTAAALLGDSPGASDVVIAVGRPSELPESADEVTKAVEAGSAEVRPWQMFERRVVITAPR